MSYILDALKKAERERERSRVPSLTTVHAEQPRPRRLRLSWLLCGTVLAALAMAGGWLAGRGPGGGAPPAPAHTGPKTPPSTTPAPERPLPPGVPSSPPRASAAPPPDPVRPGASPAAPVPPKPPAASRRLIESRTAAGGAGTPSPPALLPAAQAAPASPGPAAALPLPAAPPPPAAPAQPSAQEALSGLAVTVLVHSAEKADRLVYINGRRYGEGDSVEGFVIEAIQADGIVLLYQGERHFLRAGFGTTR